MCEYTHLHTHLSHLCTPTSAHTHLHTHLSLFCATTCTHSIDYHRIPFFLFSMYLDMCNNLRTCKVAHPTITSSLPQLDGQMALYLVRWKGVSLQSWSIRCYENYDDHLVCGLQFSKTRLVIIIGTKISVAWTQSYPSR